MKLWLFKNGGLFSFTLALLACILVPARASTLAVVNGGFETGSTSGWTTVSSAGYGSGAVVINNVANQSSQYPDFGNPLPGTAAGTYYLGITGYEGNPAEVLYQDVSANGQGNSALQPNTTYTLTVAIGVGIYDTVNNGYISLINGSNSSGTVLATANASTLGFGNYQGTFKDLTVTFTTGATVSGDLTIAIGTTHGYSSTGWMLADNVRLTAVTTQPNSVPLVNSGFETGGTSGWTTVSSAGYGSGAVVINNVANQSSQYPDFGNPLPGTAAGTYYLGITGYEGNPAEVLYQDVSANGQGNSALQPNTTYTLTVAIGVGIYDTVNNGYISLINGSNASGTVLATVNASTLGFGNYQGTFKDLTVTFTTGATVSGDLTIAIGTTHGYSVTGWMLADNVRLTKSSGTPPPPPQPGGVLNGGFEVGTLSGWTTVASGGYGSGAFLVNNVTSQSGGYPDFANPLPGTATGTYYLGITGYDGNPAEVIYQDVSANGLGNGTLLPNTTYTLLVSIGVGRYDGIDNGFVSLINGTNASGTVLATANVSSLGMGSYAGTFRDILLTYKTGATTSGDLTVAIGTTHGYPSSGWMLVDNVRLTVAANAAETIGGGSISSPAAGPQPAYGVGGTGFTLVKNWHFGSNGTVKNNTDLTSNFQFHDPFGLDENNNYGARIVAPDSADAVSGQPYEGQLINGVAVPTVRSYLADCMRTFIVPLGGATTITPASHLGGTINAGSGSFQAKWNLPHGGSLLGQDIIWETRLRYIVPPYFWFAIWNVGNAWNQGAEMDLVETFGFDNTPQGGGTNYTGSQWHSNSVNGSDQVDYSNFANGMNSVGIATFDPTVYHIWTLAYYKDNTYAFFVDGTRIQYGSAPYWWTEGVTAGGPPVNMNFLFDGTWGSTTVGSVNHSLSSSALNGCYYEWNYSRVYLR